MVGIHVFDRALFDLDNFSGTFEVGDDIAGFEVGCAGESAVERRGRDVQSREREVTEAGVELRFRMSGKKAPPYPRRVRRIAPDAGESAEDGEPRMGERITASGGCQQHGRTG